MCEPLRSLTKEGMMLPPIPREASSHSGRSAALPCQLHCSEEKGGLEEAASCSTEETTTEAGGGKPEDATSICSAQYYGKTCALCCNLLAAFDDVYKHTPSSSTTSHLHRRSLVQTADLDGILQTLLKQSAVRSWRESEMSLRNHLNLFSSLLHRLLLLAEGLCMVSPRLAVSAEARDCSTAANLDDAHSDSAAATTATHFPMHTEENRGQLERECRENERISAEKEDLGRKETVPSDASDDHAIRRWTVNTIRLVISICSNSVVQNRIAQTHFLFEAGFAELLLDQLCGSLVPRMCQFLQQPPPSLKEGGSCMVSLTGSGPDDKIASSAAAPLLTDGFGLTLQSCLRAAVQCVCNLCAGNTPSARTRVASVLFGRGRLPNRQSQEGPKEGGLTACQLTAAEPLPQPVCCLSVLAQYLADKDKIWMLVHTATVGMTADELLSYLCGDNRGMLLKTICSLYVVHGDDEWKCICASNWWSLPQRCVFVELMEAFTDRHPFLHMWNPQQHIGHLSDASEVSNTDAESGIRDIVLVWEALLELLPESGCSSDVQERVLAESSFLRLLSAHVAACTASLRRELLAASEGHLTTASLLANTSSSACAASSPSPFPKFDCNYGFTASPQSRSSSSSSAGDFDAAQSSDGALPTSTTPTAHKRSLGSLNTTAVADSANAFLCSGRESHPFVRRLRLKERLLVCLLDVCEAVALHELQARYQRPRCCLLLRSSPYSEPHHLASSTQTFDCEVQSPDRPTKQSAQRDETAAAHNETFCVAVVSCLLRILDDVHNTKISQLRMMKSLETDRPTSLSGPGAQPRDASSAGGTAARPCYLVSCCAAILRLIGVLMWKRKTVFKRFRELDGERIVLNYTTIDDSNPMAREASLTVIKYITDESPDSQAHIRDLISGDFSELLDGRAELRGNREAIQELLSRRCLASAQRQP